MKSTRGDLHRLCAHVLGRRRFAVSGHFGLRAVPGGLATPAFGPEPETLRITSACLIRDVGTEARGLALAGATLAELADFAGADLDAEFSPGTDTPALGRIEEPLQMDATELDELFSWFDLGSRVLDEVTAERLGSCRQSTVQLWPEHFDVGTTLDLGDGVNLGFSPGDAFSEDPYIYVGPVGAVRPGDDGYWNAPFGAVLPRSRVHDAADGLSFIRTGLERLS
ncbi:MAG TPA: hypothetical protein VG244_10450 [Acidimicrobiales bacterium]|jgi:hypothetical protein|nr:hypothetical protein [Acidimicrobiales bacterium]